MKNKIYVLILLFAFTAGACAPVLSPSEEIPTPVEESLPVPTAEPEPTSQPDLPVSTAWRAFRDPNYGFGLAVPCWWIIHPIPERGTGGGAMTLYNYDEAYFNAHSSKGFWDWPNGSLKIDVIVMEGADPTISDADAYMQFTDPTMSGLVSAEQQQIGAHTATVATLSNLVNTSDPDVKLFIFRIAPDILFMVNPIPQSIIDTPDFQAILASIVLTQDEQITPPTITPAPALINASCAQ